MRIFLIRHGQTPSNVEGSLDTSRPGPGLTGLGQAEAAALAQALQGREISAVYVSPLVRTHETAAPLAQERGLEPIELEGLEEIIAGDLEMKSDHESVTEYIGMVLQWLQGNLEHAVPGGEDGHTFYGRFEAALQQAIAGRGDDETVAVVSHGAGIRAFAARFEGPHRALGDQAFLRNTGAVELDVAADGAMRVVSWSVEPLGAEYLEAATVTKS